MKKRLIAVITFALVLLSSCGGQSGLNDDTTSVGRYENSRIENREGSETESSARSSFLESESELSEKTLDSEQTESTTESKTEQRKQTGTASKSSQENKQQAQTGQKQSAGKTPQTQKEQAASSKEPQTQKPEAAPEKPSASSKPSTVSKAESNPSSTPQAPAFHVSEYIQLAKNYGQNVGLALDSTATDCWDDPITANANCRYLKRVIQDRLDWYKASGFTAFWVWSEQVGSGEYLIYIGYA